MRVKEYNNGYISGKDFIIEEIDLINMEKDDIKRDFNIDIDSYGNFNLNQLKQIYRGLNNNVPTKLFLNDKYDSGLMCNVIHYYSNGKVASLADIVLHLKKVCSDFKIVIDILNSDNFDKNKAVNAWDIKKVNKLLNNDILSYENDNTFLTIKLKKYNLPSTMNSIVINKKSALKYDDIEKIDIRYILDKLSRRMNSLNDDIEDYEKALNILEYYSKEW